jgi:hypothetical protein
LERRTGTAGIEKREMAQRIVEVGGEKPESAHQQNDQDNPAQSHGLQNLKTFLIQIRRSRAKVLPDDAAACLYCRDKMQGELLLRILEFGF